MASDNQDKSKDTVFTTWKSEYSVGDPDINDQHRDMLEIIRELYLAVRDGSSPKIVTNTLLAVEMYISQHLEHEEKILRQCGYPELEAHIDHHNEMRRWFKETKELHRAGASGLTQEMIVFLKNWWVNHITKMDVQYSSHLTEETHATSCQQSPDE